MRLNIIEENPTDKILKTSQSDKERGVLTREEVIALRNKLEEKKNTLFPSFYYGILLGIITGMRISEISSLCTDDIVPSSNPELYKVIIRPPPWVTLVASRARKVSMSAQFLFLRRWVKR